ncbi:NUDIX domain-containing protein [Nioella sp.]|uniref:NUDIX domain-containing protein n=1 Tax=Nioella sp. TaxID=1912091 RepID=UPI003A8B4EA3
MTPLFFFGTLRHQPLLDIVLGRVLTPEPAHLPGYRVAWAKGESFPMLAADAGRTAEGVLAHGLTDDDMDRLNFYEGAFSYDLVDVTVEGATGPVPSRVFMPKEAPWHPGADWQLQDWVDQWGPLTLIAAGEVMRAYGRETASQVAARFPIIRARAQSYVMAQNRRRPVTVSSALTREDIELSSLDRPYEKFFALEEYETRFRRFDGQWSDTGARAIFNVGDAVTVLPFDPARDMVMLIEQLRIGAYAQGDPQPWLLEPVAGIVDAGESYEDTAYRETREEAHIELSALHKVAGYYPSPGGIAQYLVSYVGIASLADDRKTMGGLESEGENIRNLLVPYDQLVQMLESGELVNAPMVMSVQWLMLNRDRLRA